ncbi:MAG: Methionine biosynthesis protein MetW [Candidatus Wolfebacteria bacterium GW2011_GWA2_42_10]|uniref:Methionine biosynthesis protein MetW n=1 Tax=Candidatus Wolfebacteria bacterium GW2011_GWA2_42_10 TaxID=1619004 RepID=A0A0G0ZSG9_9BACT|nr:MAG: Methionine biosynthesis protein MetW [Candidatus Wolfebacteria bacterium GW2011_GWA2_42_10]
MFYFPNTRRPNFKIIKKIDYNLYWQERGFTLNKKLKEREEIILELVPVGAKVLDIGCGNSFLPIALKKKGCIVTIADISTEVLNGYDQFGLKGMFIDLEQIAKTENNFDRYDYIILSEVLEHVSNSEEIITTLAKQTDYFLLTVPNSAFYRYRLHLMFTGRFFTQWVYHPSEHLRFWSDRDFRDWLLALGLDLLKVEASNGLDILGLPLYRWWSNLFGHQIVYLCATKNI